MTKNKEILRLANLGINQSGIASSCGCARKTVRDVLARAKELQLSYPLNEETSDAQLQRLLFPDKALPTVERKLPDYEYIDKKMMKSGVTLKLLWSEYCETCRQTRELPLMYSQFCFHYHKYREKTKATMHILRKPGEQCAHFNNAIQKRSFRTLHPPALQSRIGSMFRKSFVFKHFRPLTSTFLTSRQQSQHAQSMETYQHTPHQTQQNYPQQALQHHVPSYQDHNQHKQPAQH